LLSTLAILSFASSDASTIKRSTDWTFVKAEIKDSWREEGKAVHRYVLHIENHSSQSICGVNVEISGHLKQRWNLESCEGSYCTPDWFVLKPGAVSSDAGFISYGVANVKLLTVREC
ncbi:hypothetical protein PFISCL1PPCAC_13384, partial [Pristionchus fissidentatus]